MGCSPSHQSTKGEKTKIHESNKDECNNNNDNNKNKQPDEKLNADSATLKQNESTAISSPDNHVKNDGKDLSNLVLEQDMQTNTARTDHANETVSKKVSLQMDMPRKRTISIRTDDGYDEIEETEEQAEKDAVRLYEAMKGFGTHEKDLISILVPPHCTYKQLLRKIYQEKYDSDLVKAVKRDTSGSLQYLLINLLLQTDEFITSLMREFVDNRNYVAIAELLTAFSTSDVLTAKRKYQEMYDASFEEDVKKTLDDMVPKSLKDVVIPLCSLQREDNKHELDDVLIQTQADLLNQGPDEIAQLLLEKPYSRSTLAAISKCYKLKYYIDLSDSIDIEFHDDTKNFLISIVQISEDASKYFAKHLRQAIEKGDEKRILNILIARCNIDLRMIQKCYSELVDNGNLHDNLKDVFSDSCENAVSLLFRKHVS